MRLKYSECSSSVLDISTQECKEDLNDRGSYALDPAL